MMRPITNNRNTTGNVQLPEIPSHVVTSGQSSLSDDEFMSKIDEMARRDVAAGRNSRFGSVQGDEWRRLKDDFMSVASPNRTSVINNTLSDMAGRLRQMMPRLNFGTNLLQILMGHSTQFGSRDIGSNFINFRDNSGNLLAMFQDNGWTIVTTPAEEGRVQDFLRLWDEAHQRAFDEYSLTNQVIESKKNGVEIDLAEHIGRGRTFNMDKLARHGITLDAETGRTVVNPSITGGQSANIAQAQQQMASRYAAYSSGSNN
jgi:hypothetical protein